MKSALEWRAVMLIVVTMADIGAALMLGTIAGTFLALSFADLSSTDDDTNDQPRVGGILVSIVIAIVAILGFVFAVGVWRGRSTFQWAAWNLVYLVLADGGAFLFLGLIDKLRTGWLVTALLPGIGCVACVAAMVLQKKSQREAAPVSIHRIANDTAMSSEPEPSTDYRSAAMEP